jgi:hypothetical protein
MVKVFVADHPTEAHLIAGLLQSRGIASHVQGETLFATRGGVPAGTSTLPSVWVDDDAQAEEALAIITSQPTDTAAVLERPWRCGGCGELVEPQFTECWKCQAPRDNTET